MIKVELIDGVMLISGENVTTITTPQINGTFVHISDEVAILLNESGYELKITKFTFTE